MRLLLILFSIPFVALSQIEKGYIEYNYQVPAEKVIIKNAILEFSNNKSLFIYNRTDLLKNDNSGIKSEGTNVKASFSISDDYGTQVYRDFTNKIIINRFARINKLFNPFKVEDNWIAINWGIKDEYKQIGKFKAQKAIGVYRGRTYTAWFTEEIPLPYGPWKLFGLPGLILEAEDSEKMFKVEFKSIKYPCKCDFIIKKPTTEESKTLKEYVEFRDNYNDYVFKKMKSKLPRNIANKMRQIPKKGHKRKYRGEKVYEWETEEKKDK
ncbi:MAG: GLPGLI family protein [Flavobacteriaceae bacterium]|nr:MAG: GLPGLI family protein [Flavobacteriaceae bacterium]